MLGVPHLPGWTALSDMIPARGCCVVPIPEAMAYILLRPLLDDVPEDELCGVAPGRVLPISEVAPAACRSIDQHSGAGGGRFRVVALRRDPLRRAGGKSAGLGQRDVHPRRANVREEPRLCEKVKEALETGASPGDFPREDYEKLAGPFYRERSQHPR